MVTAPTPTPGALAGAGVPRSAVHLMKSLQESPRHWLLINTARKGQSVLLEFLPTHHKLWSPSALLSSVPHTLPGQILLPRQSPEKQLDHRLPGDLKIKAVCHVRACMLLSTHVLILLGEPSSFSQVAHSSPLRLWLEPLPSLEPGLEE